MAKKPKYDPKNVPEAKSIFLQAIVDNAGNITAALKAFNPPLTRSMVSRWRAVDMGFAIEWDQAVKAGIEALEDEVTRRAFEGVRRPVYQRGQLVGYIREYSDSLLMFKLKGEKPEKYRDRTTLDTGGPGSEPPQIVVNFTRKSDAT